MQNEHGIIKKAQFHSDSFPNEKMLAWSTITDSVSDGLRHVLFLFVCQSRRDGDDDLTFEEVVARRARTLGVCEGATGVLRQRPRIPCRREGNGLYQ